MPSSDIVILASYAVYEDAEARSLRPSLVYVDEKNRRIPAPDLQAIPTPVEENAVLTEA